MPTTCCVLGCPSEFLKDCGISFFRFPKEEEKRQQWLKGINRINWKPSQGARVCSKHFVDGRSTVANPYPKVQVLSPPDASSRSQKVAMVSIPRYTPRYRYKRIRKNLGLAETATKIEQETEMRRRSENFAKRLKEVAAAIRTKSVAVDVCSKKTFVDEMKEWKISLGKIDVREFLVAKQSFSNSLKFPYNPTSPPQSDTVLDNISSTKTYCVVPSCPNHAINFSGAPKALFREFPTDCHRRQVWMKLCWLPQNQQITPGLEIVCSAHFLPGYDFPTEKLPLGMNRSDVVKYVQSVFSSLTKIDRSKQPLQVEPTMKLLRFESKEKNQVVQTEKENGSGNGSGMDLEQQILEYNKWKSYKNHFFCSKTMLQMRSDQFQFHTGMSRSMFDVVAELMKKRFGIFVGINDKNIFARSLARYDWQNTSLFYLLFTLRQTVLRWALTENFGYTEQEMFYWERVSVPMLADFLKPLVFWPDLPQKMVPPGFFLPRRLEERLLKKQKSEIGIFDIVTCATAWPEWKSSFVVIYNLHGAIIFRSRLYFWEMTGNDFVEQERSIYSRIIDLFYNDYCPDGKVLGKENRILLSMRKYEFENNRNWLWSLDDREDESEEKKSKMILLEFEGRLRKSFFLFRLQKLSGQDCSHLDELVTICCSFVNLMPPVDWSEDRREVKCNLENMF